MKPIVVCLFLLPFTSHAQLSRQDSLWLPFAPFIGTWEGTGGGEPGIGKYTRSYNFILGGKFIEVRNKSVYPPTDKTPSGEVHQDIGYISYDRTRRTFVLRQFHIEGFVNQYALDSISTDSASMIFDSESIENIPAGWRARESYHIDPRGEITETFSLAPPGKSLAVYTRVTLKRTGRKTQGN